MYCAVTCDHWSSIAKVSYLAATVNFIDENWELVSFTLSCNQHSGASKAPDVLRELRKASEAFGITPDHLIAVVSDTAPVMAFFGRSLFEEYGVSHFYCTAHVLELTTGMAFNIEGAFDCMKSARALVGHFNSSSRATSDLLNIQDRANPLTIVHDVATRWWSTFSMINRLLDLKDSFGSLVRRDLLSQKANLTDNQWDAPYDIKALLEPFMIVQKVLGQSIRLDEIRNTK